MRPMTPLLDQARDYHRLGWALVPVPAGLKHPILDEWPDLQFGITDLDPKGNLAIRLGRRSGNLVDADLDCEEAIELAPFYLPPTGAVFGRKSKPRAHWL
jgi:putative DNA primase/helicase